MPAPTKAFIKLYLTTALLTGTDPLGNAVSGQRKAFLKVVDGVTVPGELPEAVDDLVDGLAEGIANAWFTWQATQPVTGTAAGVPVIGQLP